MGFVGLTVIVYAHSFLYFMLYVTYVFILDFDHGNEISL